MTDEKALDLARNIIGYADSKVAKDLNVSGAGTFLADARIVASALVARETPVKVARIRCGAYRRNCCIGCQSPTVSSAKFCWECGSRLAWK